MPACHHVLSIGGSIFNEIELQSASLHFPALWLHGTDSESPCRLPVTHAPFPGSAAQFQASKEWEAFHA